MMRESAILLRRAPATLKVVWGILVVGLIIAAHGYFTQTTWQSTLGFSVLAAGYLVAMLDVRFRKQQRREAAPIHVGLVVAPILSLALSVVTAVIGALILFLISLAREVNGGDIARLTHFLALMFSFGVVYGIPLAARHTITDSHAGEYPPLSPHPTDP